MKKRVMPPKSLQIILGLSLILNLALGFFLYESNSQNTSKSVSAEEASGIKNFQYGVDCNTVFGYKVCTSDFVGLSDGEAIYKARTYGLNPVVSSRDGKGLVVYVSTELFRINFKVKNEVVTEAFFQ